MITFRRHENLLLVGINGLAFKIMCSHRIHIHNTYVKEKGSFGSTIENKRFQDWLVVGF